MQAQRKRAEFLFAGGKRRVSDLKITEVVGRPNLVPQLRLQRKVHPRHRDAHPHAQVERVGRRLQPVLQRIVFALRDKHRGPAHKVRAHQRRWEERHAQVQQRLKGRYVHLRQVGALHVREVVAANVSVKHPRTKRNGADGDIVHHPQVIAGGVVDRFRPASGRNVIEGLEVGSGRDPKLGQCGAAEGAKKQRDEQCGADTTQEGVHEERCRTIASTMIGCPSPMDTVLLV